MLIGKGFGSLQRCASVAVPNATLLPFLYCTKTIVRSYTEQANIGAKLGQGDVEEEELQAIKDKWSTPRPEARGRGRPRKSDASATQQMRSARRKQRSSHVPFEGSTGSMNPDERFQNTTMTPREMHVFEELFRKGVQSGNAERASKPTSRAVMEREFPELLRPLAEEAKQLREQALSREDSNQTMRQSKVAEFEIKDQQSQEIQKLMDDAETDVALWKVLQTRVLEPLKEMPSDVATRENYTALPALLLHYMALISKRYPGSSLGLVLLPQLKKIGPLAFALGATTELYNQHMRLLWRHYTDVEGINDVLAEMDAEVYSFDEGTRDIITTIIDHADKALGGKFGPALQAIWNFDRRERAMVTLCKWRHAVDERLEAQAIREAQVRSFEAQQDKEDEETMEPGEQVASPA